MASGQKTSEMVSHASSCKEELKQVTNNCLNSFMYSYTTVSHPFWLTAGEHVQTVQREVAEILEGRIVVGHAIHNDLKVA